MTPATDPTRQWVMEMTRLWLDDVRPAPAGWLHARTAAEAIAILADRKVNVVSLDHDLGPPEAGTGYDVACWIEQAAADGRLPVMPMWDVHSSNPVGRARMVDALLSARARWVDPGGRDADR